MIWGILISKNYFKHRVKRATHSRRQSPSFLGHVVLKQGVLEAAVTGCQKISDIRSRMSRSCKYHCSCPKRIFVPHRSTGEKILLPELSPESGFFGLFENTDFTQLGFTDNLESKRENINKSQLNTLLCFAELRQLIGRLSSEFICEFTFGEKQDRGDRKSVLKGILFHVLHMLSLTFQNAF